MPAELSANEISELGCTYAALILHDDGVAISADKISSLLKAANVTVAPYWPGIFARVLANKNLDDLISNVGGGAAGPAVAAPTGGAAPTADAPKEDKKAKKEEKVEEEDDDMGFGLFD